MLRDVSQFHKHLGAQLTKELGDERVTVSASSDSQMGDVRKTAVLVPVIRKSTDCERGLTGFHEELQSKGAGADEEAMRIVPVLVKNLAEEKWPESCRKAGARFSFFHGVGLGQRLEPHAGAFQEKMKHLAGRLSAILKKLHDGNGSETAREPEVVRRGKAETVFLAAPTDDLRSHRRELKRKLEGLFARDYPPPHRKKEHAAEVAAAVAAAELSVHFLGLSPGEKIDDEPSKTYAVEQAEISLEKASSQLVLLPKELVLDDVEEASYREFLERLQKRASTVDKLDLVRFERRDMADVVLAKLHELRRPSESSERSVFFDVKKEHIPHVADLFVELVDRHIWPLTLAPGLGPREQRPDFEKKLDRAQIHVVVFADPDDRRWVKGRLEDALKLMMEKPEEPHQLCVYLAPPAKALDSVPYRGLVELIDGMEGFQERTLQELEAILRKVYGEDE